MNKVFPTEEILKITKIFWQYPVITEKIFYNQNKNDPNYVGIPWATIIDRPELNNGGCVENTIRPYLNKIKSYYTCCQHIFFRRHIPMLKRLNITIIYTPHKHIVENSIDGITIKPCPLYAVNIEDESRNAFFKGKDFVSVNRKYLYSFLGQTSQVNIRQKLLKINHHPNSIVKDIGLLWHFNQFVYSNKQNNLYELNETDSSRKRTEDYNKLLLDSEFSLCPAGTGPNSIRFWESLAVGSIPVIISDFMELPPHPLFASTVVRVKEAEIDTIPTLLSKISSKDKIQMKKNCIKIYNDLKNKFKYN
jgi:hypothetical protein